MMMTIQPLIPPTLLPPPPMPGQLRRKMHHQELMIFNNFFFHLKLLSETKKNVSLTNERNKKIKSS